MLQKDSHDVHNGQWWTKVELLGMVVPELADVARMSVVTVDEDNVPEGATEFMGPHSRFCIHCEAEAGLDTPLVHKETCPMHRLQQRLEHVFGDPDLTIGCTF
jgi:hypothetical protein